MHTGIQFYPNGHRIRQRHLLQCLQLFFGVHRGLQIIRRQNRQVIGTEKPSSMMIGFTIPLERKISASSNEPLRKHRQKIMFSPLAPNRGRKAFALTTATTFVFAGI